MNVKVKHQPGKHDQTKHGRKGPASGEAVGEQAAVETVAPRFDRKSWEAMPVPERLAAWKKLTKEQRDELTNAKETIKQTQAARLDFAGQRPTTGNPADAARTRLSQIGDFITKDAGEKIQKHMTALSGFLKDSGVSEDVARQIVLESVDSLAVQENESLGRTLGDHGVRHVLGDAEMALDILDKVPGVDTPQTKAAVTIAAIFHDAGYLTEPSQIFLDGDHPRWSGQHFESNLRPLIEQALGKDVTDHISYMIDTHAGTLLDWKEDPAASALRVADNMALFQDEKLPGVFKYVPTNIGVLEEVGKKTISVDDARKQMIDNINKTGGLSDKVRTALLRSANEVNQTTPKFTLGMMGGKIKGVDWQNNALDVHLERNQEAQRLQDVLDLGQRQFKKFAEAFDVDPTDFFDDDKFEFAVNNRPCLRAYISGAALKALLKAITEDEWGLDDFFETVEYDEPVEPSPPEPDEEELEEKATTGAVDQKRSEAAKKGWIKRAWQRRWHKQDVARQWKKRRQALVDQLEDAAQTRNAKAIKKIKRRIAAGDRIYAPYMKHLVGQHDQQDHGRDKINVAGTNEYNNETKQTLLDDFSSRFGFENNSRMIDGVEVVLKDVIPISDMDGRNLRPQYHLVAKTGRKRVSVRAYVPEQRLPNKWEFSSKPTQYYGETPSLEDLVSKLKRYIQVKHLPGHHDQANHGHNLKRMSNVIEEVRKMSIAELEHLLTDQPREDIESFMLKVMGEWGYDDGPGKLRPIAKKLLPLTINNGPLSYMHPGKVKLWRGGRMFSPKAVVSWSPDKKYASLYGELLEPVEIDERVPAMDLDKLYGYSMKEILTYQEPIIKHLMGQHDQESHAGDAEISPEVFAGQFRIKDTVIEYNNKIVGTIKPRTAVKRKVVNHRGSVMEGAWGFEDKKITVYDIIWSDEFKREFGVTDRSGIPSKPSVKNLGEYVYRVLTGDYSEFSPEQNRKFGVSKHLAGKHNQKNHASKLRSILSPNPKSNKEILEAADRIHKIATTMPKSARDRFVWLQQDIFIKDPSYSDDFYVIGQYKMTKKGKLADAKAAIKAALILAEEIESGKVQTDIIRVSRTPEETAAGLVVYHGTSADVAKRIMREGIKTAAQLKEDTFDELYREDVGVRVSKKRLELNRNSVYVAADKRLAAVYAQRAVAMSQGSQPPVVFRIEIPSKMLVKDTDEHRGSFYVKGGISPKYIKDYKIIKDFFKEFGFYDEGSLKSDIQTVYAPVVILDDTEEKHLIGRHNQQDHAGDDFRHAGPVKNVTELLHKYATGNAYIPMHQLYTQAKQEGLVTDENDFGKLMSAYLNKWIKKTARGYAIYTELPFVDRDSKFNITLRGQKIGRIRVSPRKV